jgi:hypothetical protein
VTTDPEQRLAEAGFVRANVVAAPGVRFWKRPDRDEILKEAQALALAEEEDRDDR